MTTPCDYTWQTGPVADSVCPLRNPSAPVLDAAQRTICGRFHDDPQISLPRLSPGRNAVEVTMSRVGEDSMRALFISAALTLLAVAPATAQIAMTGDFKAAKACPALQSIRKGTNPGDVMLQPGHSYSLIGKNKPDATHYLVAIDGAEPRERWVEVGCGETAEQPTPNPYRRRYARSKPRCWGGGDGHPRARHLLGAGLLRGSRG